MSRYQRRKQAARHRAQEWQSYAAGAVLSWADVAAATEYFTRLGRSCGLLREFAENGII